MKFIAVVFLVVAGVLIINGNINKKKVERLTNTSKISAKPRLVSLSIVQ